jgi:CubicO group peptidase (beta-lactamase class C family)
VTTRRLLNHTAGLPFGYPKNERPTRYPKLEDILNGDAGMPGATIEKEPGSAFTYSNPGYAVLELLLEEVRNKGYSDAVRALVLKPLGMEDSGFQDDPALMARVVRGHQKTGAPAERLLRYPRAAGGMLSSAHDIGRLLIGTSLPKSDGGLLEATSLAEMRKLDGASKGAFGLSDGGYALGVARAALPSGRDFVANYGSHESYNALMLSVPDTKIGFALLTNSATGLGAELELALLFFKTVAKESPRFASRVELFRRALQIGAIVAFALCLFYLLRVALAVRAGKRAWPGRLVPRRLLLRTLPLLLAAAVIFVTSNTSYATKMIAPIPPARFVSTTHEYVTAAIAIALAAMAAGAVAVPKRSRDRPAGGVQGLR